MANPKNIQIPFETFQKLLYVLEEYIDLSKYDETCRLEIEEVIDILRKKKYDLEKREAYANLVVANKSNDDEKQYEARIEYLKKKNNPFY